MNKIYFGDNLDILKILNNNTISMIYIDPPFNTGKKRKLNNNSYNDSFDDLTEFLKPRFIESKRILKENGSLLVHLDWHEVHYVKVYLDSLFGKNNFLNEIIWSYDYGARQKNKWATKHDNILWYVKDPKNYTFNYDSLPRIPYMAPGLCGEEKAKKGKTVTDVFWNTIVPTQSKEKTGYPTQKPLKLINTFIQVHSNENDLILDYFAGSGTTGESAYNNNRKFILIDNNIDSINVMKERFHNFKDLEFITELDKK